eukprot:7658394-Pyramimonas_sp.AAC.1
MAPFKMQFASFTIASGRVEDDVSARTYTAFVQGLVVVRAERQLPRGPATRARRGPRPNATIGFCLQRKGLARHVQSAKEKCNNHEGRALQENTQMAANFNATEFDTRNA